MQIDYLIPPWEHQKKAINRAKSLPGFGLFFEMGTGKTSTAINIFRHKCNTDKKFYRTLIICPPIVIPNWKEEFFKNSKISSENILCLTGPGSKRLRDFTKNAFDKSGEPKGLVAITNYEALLMKELYAAFINWRPEFQIYDESHKCKDTKAKRTKLAIELAGYGKHKLILSGSPVLNSPLDLFSQYLILDGGDTFGKNFFAFRGRYFRDKNAGMPKDRYFPKWEIMPGAIDEINRLIFQKAMRVEKKDCLDLPPLIKQTIYAPMTPEQERMYKEMKRDFLTYLGDKACTAAMALTKALRLMQLASGYIKTVDGKEQTLEGSPKMEALKALLENICPKNKVIVWAVFKNNYGQIREVCESLGLGVVEVHGDVSEKQKQENIVRFRSDPNCHVFIGHPQSAGIGLNLIEASYMVFYSRNFSLENDIQAESRNYRGGSEMHEKVTRYDLVTQNSIDEFVLEKLAGKTEVSLRLLEDWANSPLT